MTTGKVPAIDPEAVITQDGTDGQNVRFHARHFEAVAVVLRLRKRRRLSEEQKAERGERLRGFRFRPASSSSQEGPGPHVSPRNDPEVA